MAGPFECYPGNDPPHTCHVHSHLSIFLDAVALAIPDDIEFFMIWGHPLRPDKVAGLTGNPNNGVVTEATGDWNDIELISHREIMIQAGTPIAEVPNYTWSAH